jgi:hypothetical protein
MVDKYIFGSGNRLIAPSTLEDLDRLASQLESELSQNPNGVMPKTRRVRKTRSDVFDSLIHTTPLGLYELTDAFETYALGVESIRTISSDSNYNQKVFEKPDGSQIYRPLTMLESLEVMVNDYNILKDANGQDRTPEDRKRLLSNYKDTSTGIAYKAESTQITIIPECKELILIPTDYKKLFLENPYRTLTGIPLDTANVTYNQALKEFEVNDHPAWIASVGGTVDGIRVLKEYSHIIFNILAKKKQTTGMGFYIRKDAVTQNTATDELRALYFGNIDNNSVAYGDGNLNYDARFLLVAPSQKNLGS